MDEDQQPTTRIFMGLREVAGFYSQLHKGFRSLGYTCRLAQSQAHEYAYATKAVRFPLLNPLARFHYVSQRCRIAPVRWLLLLIWYVGWQILRWPLFVWAAMCHKVFILRAMVPFLPFYLELPLLKLFRRRIVMTYHGTESRPAFMNGKFMNRSPWFVRHVVPWICWMQRRVIGWADRFCDVVLEHTATGMYHRKPFLIYLCAGVPVDVSSPPAPPRSAGAGPAKALHCPSEVVTGTKGTPQVRAAVEEVRRRGVAVELVELTGVPNSAVLEAIGQCDFVIDEIWSDSPMAGFAAEAASRGRAAVVGGYYSEILTDEVPAEAIPPSRFVMPDNLANAIADLASDRQACQQLGADAYEFVHRYWDASRVAERLLQALDGAAPAEWFFRPEDSRYLLGYGMSNDLLRQTVSDLVGCRGVRALQLHGRPHLLQAVESFLAQGAD